MSQIKVGDLVVVIKACCEKVAEEGLGAHFVVGSFKQREMVCDMCGWSQTGTAAYPADGKILGRFDRSPLAWLKRIPPLSELESEKNKEEISV